MVLPGGAPSSFPGRLENQSAATSNSLLLSCASCNSAASSYAHGFQQEAVQTMASEERPHLLLPPSTTTCPPPQLLPPEAESTMAGLLSIPSSSSSVSSFMAVENSAGQFDAATTAAILAQLQQQVQHSQHVQAQAQLAVVQQQQQQAEQQQMNIVNSELLQRSLLLSAARAGPSSSELPGTLDTPALLAQLQVAVKSCVAPPLPPLIDLHAALQQYEALLNGSRTTASASMQPEMLLNSMGFAETGGGFHNIPSTLLQSNNLRSILQPSQVAASSSSAATFMTLANLPATSAAMQPESADKPHPIFDLGAADPSAIHVDFQQSQAAHERPRATVRRNTASPKTIKMDTSSVASAFSQATIPSQSVRRSSDMASKASVVESRVACGSRESRLQRNAHQEAGSSTPTRSGVAHSMHEDSAFTNKEAGNVKMEDDEEEIQYIAEHVIKSLNEFGWAVVDKFMGSTHCRYIQKEMEKLYQNGAFTHGQIVEGPASSRPDVSQIRSDFIYWFAGTDEAAAKTPTIRLLISMIDSLIMHFEGRIGNQNIGGRSRAMLAIYPARGSRYVRHVDNPAKDGRLITCIYYGNENWDLNKHGGALRLYPSTSATPMDIDPQADRLVFFWSDRRNPHEVMPVFRHRFAITIWYMDKREREEQLKRADGGKERNDEGLVRKKKSRHDAEDDEAVSVQQGLSGMVDTAKAAAQMLVRDEEDSADANKHAMMTVQSAPEINKKEETGCSRLSSHTSAPGMLLLRQSRQELSRSGSSSASSSSGTAKAGQPRGSNVVLPQLSGAAELQEVREESTESATWEI